MLKEQRKMGRGEESPERVRKKEESMVEMQRKKLDSEPKARKPQGTASGVQELAHILVHKSQLLKFRNFAN